MVIRVQTTLEYRPTIVGVFLFKKRVNIYIYIKLDVI